MARAGENSVLQIPPEYFEQFYGKLVGSQEAAEEVVSQLGSAVAASAAEVSPLELFDELHCEASGLVGLIAEDFGGKMRTDSLMRRQWYSLSANADTGVDIAVSGLRSAGLLYECNAPVVPQRLTVVRRNAYRVLDRLSRFAHFANADARSNLAVLHRGLDPGNDRDCNGATANLVHTTYPVDYSQGFKAAFSDEGQLIIAPKSRKTMGSPGERRCPGSVTKVPGVFETSSAVLAFSRLLGEVAISHIYPRLCEVVDDTSSAVMMRT